MSRLDYVTVSIVAICLAALGFLVYKTVGLMNNEGEETEIQADTTQYVDPFPIDSTKQDTSTFTDPAFSYTDEDPDDAEVKTYSEENLGKDIVSDSKTTSKSGTPEVKKKTETTKTETPKTTAKTTTPTKETVVKKPAAVATPKAPAKAAETGYSVQAGAFKSRANAETLVKELKRLGYANAEVGMINNGALAVAVVDRFSDFDDAAALVKTLKTKHNIDALVRQPKK